MQHLKKSAIRILMITLLLVMLSLLISYAMRNSALSLKDILFWVGTAPIALFSILIFGTISGKTARSGKNSEPISARSADQQLPMKNSSALKRASSGLPWVIAGLLVWLLGYLM